MNLVRASVGNRTLRGLLLCLVIEPAASACRSEQERAISRDVAAVAHVVNQLREAPHNAKDTPLQTLSQLPCQSPPACELQQICVQAYRLHADTVKLAAKASAALRDGRNEAIARQLLDRAEQDLEQARQGTLQCVELEGQLTREYRL